MREMTAEPCPHISYVDCIAVRPKPVYSPDMPRHEAAKNLVLRRHFCYEYIELDMLREAATLGSATVLCISDFVSVTGYIKKDVTVFKATTEAMGDCRSAHTTENTIHYLHIG